MLTSQLSSSLFFIDVEVQVVKNQKCFQVWGIFGKQMFSGIEEIFSAVRNEVSCCYF